MLVARSYGEVGRFSSAAERLLGWTEATAGLQVEVALQHPKVRAIANALGTPPADVIQEILVQAGISAADWRKALADKTYKEQAEAQRAAGVAAGVDATPTVFVNGRKLDLIPSAEILAITVDAELDWQKTRGTWTTATR